MKESEPRASKGLLLGDGLFETCRVVGGRALLLDRHIARLRRSGEALDFAEEEIQAGAELIESFAGRRDGLWRATVVRGGGVSAHYRETPRRGPPKLTSLKGFYFPGDLMAEHKTLSWMRSVQGLRMARERGCDEAVWISPEGRIGEACAANLFFLIDNQWATPPVDGLLPGVYRAALLRLSGEAGISIRERPVFQEELDRCRAVILTSAGRLFQPAAELDGRRLEEHDCQFLNALLEILLK